MKVKAKGAWKSIPLPQSIFTGVIDSAMCGGIEILDDYSISKQDAGTLPNSGTKTVPKRKRETENKGGVKKAKFGFTVVDLEPSSDPSPVNKILKENVPRKKKVPLVIKQDGGGLVKSDKSEKKKKKKNKKKQSNNKPAINIEALTKKLEEKAQPDSNNMSPKPKSPKSEIPKLKKKEKIKEDKLAVKDKEEKVEIQVASSTPLDMNAWREVFVCEEIIKALEEKGFSSPTSIQKLTLPAALKGN